MLKGSCLCGGIRYEVRELGPILNCHCSMCRKAHSAAFRTRAVVRTSDLVWISGYELLTRYTSSPGQERSFCKVCGSVMVTFREDNPDSLKLSIGTLDSDPGRGPECHVFVGSKAPWFEITDELPQFETWPEDPKRHGIASKKSGR